MATQLHKPLASEQEVKMEGFRVDLVGRETIKPSRPTPTHLATHSLSLFDQLIPPLYVPLLLFYPAVNGVPSNPSRFLRPALSATLSRYYPFAGRLKNFVSVDCNDEGVTFVEAKTSSKLSDFLKKPNYEELDQLFPDGLQWKECESDSLLAIQITGFACGGITIGFCVSHTLADACTMMAFIKHLASITRSNGGEEPLSPQFDAALLFPPGDLPPARGVQEHKTKVVSRRFVFSASKLSALKSMVSLKVENPTAVKVVCALMFKAAISASSRSLSVPINDFTFRQAVNLRTRVEPSLPESYVGNIISLYTISAKNAEIELWSLVDEMKASLAELCQAYATEYKNRSPELKNQWSESNEKMYHCTSWRRLGVYEVDFGWGKPKWATTARIEIRNSIFLLEGEKGEGIEALVILDEEDMAAFEVDEQLLSYASLNPMVNWD